MVPELRFALRAFESSTFHVDPAEHDGINRSGLIAVRSAVGPSEVTLWIVLDFLAGALGLGYSRPSRSSQIKESPKTVPHIP